ncbi:MAG: hypothetical protein ACC669_06655 [bacterium]
MLKITAKSHQDAAIQLAEYLKKHGWAPVGCKPWNRFDPDLSHWLVIPSMDWPAYRYGKYFFIQKEDSGHILCGLTVEKGLGQSYLLAFPVPKAKPFIMDDEWTWHVLLNDLRSGSFQSALDAIVNTMGVRVFVEITSGPNDDPEMSYDPKDLIKWDRAEFTYCEGELSLEGSEINDGCLSEVAQVASLPELGEALVSIPNPDWIWTNFDIYLKGSLADDSSVDTDESIHRVWNNYLSKLERWFC